MRGATAHPSTAFRTTTHFNPRAPCGARQRSRAACLQIVSISIHAPHAGRDLPSEKVKSKVRISIHAPHAGRDPRIGSQNHIPAHFNPRAPCGARRHSFKVSDKRSVISIHAPHAGRDASVDSRASVPSDFNPRAPCGARPRGHFIAPPCFNFNPRAPCGARPGSVQKNFVAKNFNPRAPCGARPLLVLRRVKHVHISIHAPHAGRDGHSFKVSDKRSVISIHAPHAGRDVTVQVVCLREIEFQSTRPMRGATTGPL